jgi:hypothetical protein
MYPLVPHGGGANRYWHTWRERIDQMNTIENHCHHQQQTAVEWMEELKRTAPARVARRTAAQLEGSLPARIARWYAALPPGERSRLRPMSDFEKLFEQPSKLIGPALHELGWVRTRKWTGGPYCRAWVPPTPL